MSKVNCKHQKSIANSKIQTQFWEKIAISGCFSCFSAGKRREIRTMNLQIHATLRYWIFSSKVNVHKSSFGLCSLAPGPIKGSGAQKQRPYELLWTLWFNKKVYLSYIICILKKSCFWLLMFPWLKIYDSFIVAHSISLSLISYLSFYCKLHSMKDSGKNCIL